MYRVVKEMLFLLLYNKPMVPTWSLVPTMEHHNLSDTNSKHGCEMHEAQVSIKCLIRSPPVKFMTPSFDLRK